MHRSQDSKADADVGGFGRAQVFHARAPGHQRRQLCRDADRGSQGADRPRPGLPGTTPSLSARSLSARSLSAPSGLPRSSDHFGGSRVTAVPREGVHLRSLPQSSAHLPVPDGTGPAMSRCVPHPPIAASPERAFAERGGAPVRCGAQGARAFSTRAALLGRPNARGACDEQRPQPRPRQGRSSPQNVSARRAKSVPYVCFNFFLYRLKVS